MNFEKSYYFPFDTELIKQDCLGKSGVYLVLNLINGDCYVGSGTSSTDKHNRLYIRFRNHFYNTQKATNVLLRKALIKYGQKNFSFNILVFAPSAEILNLESAFINKLKPTYNILQSAHNSLGYKHSPATIEKMKENYSEERKITIGNLNRGKELNEKTRELLSEAMSKRHELGLVNIKPAFTQSRSKITQIYDLNGKCVKEYKSAKEAAIGLSIDYRTVRRHIKSGEFIRGILIKYKS